MNSEDIGLIGISILLLIIILWVVIVWFVASTIPSLLGLTGIRWWAFAIFSFVVISLILSMIRSKIK